MSSVKSRDTTPELSVRSAIHRMGFRYSLHDRGLAGTPDIVLNRLRKVIFVNGCFWHQHTDCAAADRPKSNREFWDNKLDENIHRDQRNLEILLSDGWDALTVWECEIGNKDKLATKLLGFIDARQELD
ncbi:MAG: DNA mismatch endonuclease Vsr [Chloroflexi bacterium]|nr:DNA mismatch endonuclease Vsr [Chloroflexota bacterium]